MDLNKKFVFWNWTYALSAIFAGFFLITNGIPMIQAGWIEPFKQKKDYVNCMRAAVSIFFILTLYLYWKHRPLLVELGITRLARRFTEAPLNPTLWILTAVYVFILSAISIFGHWRGETGSDMAIFVQALWNSVHGNFLYSSIKDGICLLGDHVSPILILMIPLYAVWPEPELVLILQALATGSCVFLIGSLAKEKLGDTVSGVLFGLMFFFYHSARFVVRDDFHPEVLVEPFIILAFMFLEKRRVGLFFLFLLLVMSGKENMLGVSFILGFYAFAFKKMKALGAFVMFLSAGLFLFELKWLVPHLTNGKYAYPYYSHLKNSSDFVRFMNPAWFSNCVKYLGALYSPFLFLPFLHPPTLLLSFPILVQNLLSQNVKMRTFSFHYTAGMHGFLFIASIFGFGVLTSRFKWCLRHKRFLLFCLFLISLTRSGPSEYYYFWRTAQLPPPVTETQRIELRKIGPEYSVLTAPQFTFPLIHRKYFYFLDLKTRATGENLRRYKIDYVVLDANFWPADTYTSFSNALETIRGSGYRPEYEHDGFYIYKRVG